MAAGPQISAFFDEPTNTVPYLVADSETRAAVVIDPVLNYDPASGSVATTSAEQILVAAEEWGWSIGLILETHPHADHLTAAPVFKKRTGAKVGIGPSSSPTMALATGASSTCCSRTGSTFRWAI